MASEQQSALAPPRPAWVEIDLGALRGNLERIRESVKAAGVLAVVKADAYGHGAVRIAGALAQAGVDWLGVALVEEGIELRQAEIETPILVLGPLESQQLSYVLSHRLVPVVSSLEQLRMWAAFLRARKLDEPLVIHLKVDSGMNRLGIPGAEWKTALALLQEEPGLRLGGLLSHLAASEDLSSPRNAEQEAVFRQALDLVERLQAPARMAIHIANSAAALHRPSTHWGLVRAGLALYGIDPAAKDQRLEPIMAVRARIVQMRQLEVGAAVGYGGEWVAARPSRVGIVPIGYADGYSWRLGNRSEVIAAGRRVPVVGSVSMDMLTIDLTDTDAGLGSEVTLVGKDGSQSVSAVELAGLAATLSYELLCHFGLRLPKRFLEGGCEVRAP